jgi:putative ABC transport system permease protein
MRLALVGVSVGVPMALVLTRVMGGVLSDVTGPEPVIYALAVGLLVASALLASYLPARRATRIDPLTALRTE